MELKPPEKIGTMQTSRYGVCDVIQAQYEMSPYGIAILLQNNGELISVLSVNLDSAHKLGDNEFWVKTWSENEQITSDAIQSELFEDTGIRQKTGYVEAQLWRIKQIMFQVIYEVYGEFRSVIECKTKEEARERFYGNCARYGGSGWDNFSDEEKDGLFREGSYTFSNGEISVAFFLEK